MLDVFFRKLLCGGLLLACLPALSAPQTGRQQAQQCATCHGLQGLATMANTPHLAGQPDVYLIEQLKAFRNGQRQHAIMSLIAKPLSDAEIENLAQWFSSQQIEIKQ